MTAYLDGTASDAERSKRLGLLRKMHKIWPFFKNLLSNMDMVLAKTDLAVASRYAQLVADKKLRKTVFDRIVAEHQRTSDVLAEACRDYWQDRTSCCWLGLSRTAFLISIL